MTDRLIAEVAKGAPSIEFIEGDKWWSDLERANDALLADMPTKPVDAIFFFAEITL